MNIDSAFPSNYLKATDIGDATPTVTIKEVVMEKLGEDTRPVMYFVGKDKGVVLNKTNATNIREAYGADTDEWTGKKVTLFTAWVDFQGRSVEAIRMRPSRGGSAPAAAPVAMTAPQFDSPPPDREFAPSDADIPF